MYEFVNARAPGGPPPTPLPLKMRMVLRFEVDEQLGEREAREHPLVSAPRRAPPAVLATAIGAAGLPCLLDLRGREDRPGFKLQTTEVGAADEIAAAAPVLMGQASEGIAVVLVRGIGFEASEGRAADLSRSTQEDLFP